ncbi:SOUL family heme-binding protein [Mycobacterium cookii]|uniref:SOUL family heme-binding protein n=1 Tax=Mycobacterium cookii TaxID=1775 RepID=UPI0035566392
MLTAVVKIAKSIIEAGGSVVGFRGFTEEPAHSTQRLPGGVELRRYEARVAAETTVDDPDEESARRIGFQRLAGYIFGANHVDIGAPKRAPVVAQFRGGRGEKIAMTAPVTQYASPEGQWVIRFFMPSAKTLESLPAPDDPAVSLVTAPAETIAVRRFSGSTSPDALAAQTAALVQTLHDQGLEATDSPAVWFYDPPWTLPFLRRTEIVIPVRPAA